MKFESNDELKSYLSSIESEKLAAFNRKLMETDKKMYGIPIPALKKLSSECAAMGYGDFCRILSNESFEEILLLGLAVNYPCRDLDERMERIDAFLNRADNWAHIDCCVSSYKFIKKDKRAFRSAIEKYIRSGQVFGVRFAIVCLLGYYIDEENLGYVFDTVNGLDCSSYYVSMAAAWLVSAAYIKFPVETERFFAEWQTDAATRGRAIQKILDSRRVSAEAKNRIKTLKR